LQTKAQGIDTLSLNHEDSMELMRLDSLYKDSILRIDTLFYAKFIPFDREIFRKSKINLRKTLTASHNPPIRRNLNNYLLFIWAFVIALFILFFKNAYALQYRLINKAWFSSISFNEFFTKQTSVFTNSKLMTWLIISQSLAMGLFVFIKSSYAFQDTPDLLLVLYVSGFTILLMLINQWLKNVFAYAFSQPALNKDYAIIYRIHAYSASLVLLPVLLMVYYSSTLNLRLIVIVIMVVYMMLVYATSIFKFVFSGRFLQNQSNFILILYLCAFEILPLLVLIKSINTILAYD
jgi:hypothetical protein